MKRLHLFVSGRVQGVFFRESTRREAEALGVRGWVRNLPDGRVEAVLEGPEGRVEALADWCRQGPGAAVVEDVQVAEEPISGDLVDFKIVP